MENIMQNKIDQHKWEISEDFKNDITVHYGRTVNEENESDHENLYKIMNKNPFKVTVHYKMKSGIIGLSNIEANNETSAIKKRPDDRILHIRKVIQKH